MIRVTTLVAVATALVFAASGCGGSKKSNAGSSGSTSTVASGGTSSSGSSSSSSSSGSSGSSSTTSGSSSSGSSSSGSSSTGSSSGNGGSTNNISKSCLDFAGTASKLGQALASGSSSTSQSAENLKTYFNSLADRAPSDIKASFQTLADAISKYVDAIKKLDIKPGQTPNPADLQKMQAAVQSISTPNVQKASDKIQAWVKAGCHS
jgi:hypothetical protein